MVIRRREDVAPEEFHRYWREDEARFIDLKRSSLFLSEEHVVVD